MVWCFLRSAKHFTQQFRTHYFWPGKLAIFAKMKQSENNTKNINLPLVLWINFLIIFNLIISQLVKLIFSRPRFLECLVFDFSEIFETCKTRSITKRNAVKILSMFHDPFGLLKPILIILRRNFIGRFQKLVWKNHAFFARYRENLHS